MPGIQTGTGSIAPQPRQYGWYKRRLPVMVPLPAGSAGPSSVAGGVLPVLVIRPLRPPNRGAFYGGQPSRPRSVGPRPVPVRMVRGDYRRAGTFFRAPLVAGHANVAGGVPRPFVVKQDYERGGAFYRAAPLLKPPPASVAGGVLVPWVVRRDYRRGGSVFWMRPLLKAPPPSVPGGVPVAVVRRWDFERAGLVYRERFVFYPVPPPLTPPAVIQDRRTWYACDRDNEWDSCNRALKWSADVIELLVKRSGETRQYTMDFSALPELQTAALAGVSSVTATTLTVGASALTLTNPALGSDGKSAVVTIAGGSSGSRYKITFTVTIAGGTVLEDFGYLWVEDE